MSVFLHGKACPPGGQSTLLPLTFDSWSYHAVFILLYYVFTLSIVSTSLYKVNFLLLRLNLKKRFYPI
jgi:hypothetical protein